MIQLTTETRLNKHGEEVDTSLYLIHFDSRNLAIVEGKPQVVNGKKQQKVLGYYGNVRTALTKSIDIAIKHGCCAQELPEMLQRIDDLTQTIETLCSDTPTMLQIMKEK